MEHFLNKLDYLLEVLTVALWQVRRHKGQPGADPKRLELLERNLRIAVVTCKRIRRSINGPTSGAREYVETSSLEEFKKFQAMPPITKEDIMNVDMFKLTRQFQEPTP